MLVSRQSHPVELPVLFAHSKMVNNYVLVLLYLNLTLTNKVITLDNATTMKTVVVLQSVQAITKLFQNPFSCF